MTEQEQMFLQEINLVFKKYEHKKDALIPIENMFKAYIEKNPNSIDILIYFALFLYLDVHDDMDAMDILTQVLKHDPDNVIAVLILAYMSYTFHRDKEDEALEMLEGLPVQDDEVQSMIEYSKSRFFGTPYADTLEKLLVKSIALCPSHVHNNFDLGKFYLRQGKIAEGRAFITRAVHNIKMVYPVGGYDDCILTTPEEFINEMITGVHATQAVYDLTKEYIEKDVSNMPWWQI